MDILVLSKSRTKVETLRIKPQGNAWLEREKPKYVSANLPHTPPGHNSRESGSELGHQCPLLVIKDGNTRKPRHSNRIG